MVAPLSWAPMTYTNNIKVMATHSFSVMLCHDSVIHVEKSPNFQKTITALNKTITANISSSTDASTSLPSVGTE